MKQVEAQREVILLGVDRYIEIWDKQVYLNGSLLRDELGDLAEKILGEHDPITKI
jgi:MraZ protein